MTHQVLKMYGSYGDSQNGVFEVPSPIDGATVRVLASIGEGWEHVSVSRYTRCPNWPEMEHIKRMFFREDECVMQLHVPIADYVTGEFHGCVNCLHLWKPTGVEIPRPPKWMIGGMTKREAIEAMVRKTNKETDNGDYDADFEQV
jgi:hypothetical protein